MQIIGNLFNIIIFVGFIGSLFSIAIIFLQKVLHNTLPIWSGIMGMIFYIVPFIVPDVKLISPEESLWIAGYKMASIIWLIGVVLFLCYYLLRGVLAHLAIKKYPRCVDERIVQIYINCATQLNVKKLPRLIYGTLKDPACVFVTIFDPVIILNHNIINQLSDKELQIVLSHELEHVKRKHHTLQRIFDFISAVYWCNPIIWMAKTEFSCTCEMDCDIQVLKKIDSYATVKEYTTAMIHLMELSTGTNKIRFGKIGALSFLTVKQRFINILHRPSRRKLFASLIAMALCVILTIIFSTKMSRAMFYPYPAYIHGVDEYGSNEEE